MRPREATRRRRQRQRSELAASQDYLDLSRLLDGRQHSSAMGGEACAGKNYYGSADWPCSAPLGSCHQARRSQRSVPWRCWARSSPALATIGHTVPIVVGVCIAFDIPLVLGSRRKTSSC